MTTTELILLIIASSTLAYEITYHKITYWLKSKLTLHKKQPVLALLLKRFIRELVSCPYCLSFHIAFWIAVLVFNQGVLLSFFIGLTAMFSTGLYHLIRNNAL